MIKKYKSIVYKANKQGAGFIRLPVELFSLRDVGTQLNISLFLDKNEIQFFAKIRNYVDIGFFVPLKITSKYNLLNLNIEYTFTTIDGFVTTTSSDGRIYLPKNLAEELKPRINEILQIESLIDEQRIIEYCQIKIRKKGKTSEYYCMFNPKLKNKVGVFKINLVISRNKVQIPDSIKSLFNNFNYAQILPNRAIIYHGNRVPVVINPKIDIDKYAHYLGCFFSDGTKKGNSWGICASTF
jgi:hypothetical protein